MRKSDPDREVKLRDEPSMDVTPSTETDEMLFSRPDRVPDTVIIPLGEVLLPARIEPA